MFFQKLDEKHELMLITRAIVDYYCSDDNWILSLAAANDKGVESLGFSVSPSSVLGFYN